MSYFHMGREYDEFLLGVIPASFNETQRENRKEFLLAALEELAIESDGFITVHPKLSGAR